MSDWDFFQTFIETRVIDNDFQCFFYGLICIRVGMKQVNKICLNFFARNNTILETAYCVKQYRKEIGTKSAEQVPIVLLYERANV